MKTILLLLLVGTFPLLAETCERSLSGCLAICTAGSSTCRNRCNKNFADCQQGQSSAASVEKTTKAEKDPTTEAYAKRDRAQEKMEKAREKFAEVQKKGNYLDKEKAEKEFKQKMKEAASELDDAYRAIAEATKKENKAIQKKQSEEESLEVKEETITLKQAQELQRELDNSSPSDYEN